MQRRYTINRGLAFILAAAVFASVFYHTDVIGRVAYAYERGKLQADLEHLGDLDTTDIAALETVSHAFSIIAEVVKRSVVHVEARSSLDISDRKLLRLFNDRGYPLPPRKGTGSGIVIDEEGHIVTNNHVIAGAEVVDVTLADGRVYRADITGTDEKTDLAIIKINANRLHPARFGESERMKVGNIVLAIGSPFTLDHSVSHGIISALGRVSRSVDIDYQNWIQTDAPINPGNSGGPLVNTRGEVIGINTAIATETGGHQGVGFAIPAKTVIRIVEFLKNAQEVQRGYLGVSIKQVDHDIADAYDLEEPTGVFVGGVGPDTPAEQGGLQPRDIIQALDGEKIETLEQLQEYIAYTKAETDVEITVWRDGSHHQLTVRIGGQPDGFSTTGSIWELHRDPREQEGLDELPDDELDTDDQAVPEPDAAEESDTERDFEKLGFSADTVSHRLKRTYKLDKGIQNGALVTRVSPAGEGFAAGLRPGHVIVRANDKRIRNVGEMGQILTKAAIAKGVRLKVRLSIRLEPDEEERFSNQAYYYTVLRVR